VVVHVAVAVFSLWVLGGRREAPRWNVWAGSFQSNPLYLMSLWCFLRRATLRWPAVAPSLLPAAHASYPTSRDELVLVACPASASAPSLGSDHLKPEMEALSHNKLCACAMGKQICELLGVWGFCLG